MIFALVKKRMSNALAAVLWQKHRFGAVKRPIHIQSIAIELGRIPVIPERHACGRAHDAPL